MKKMIIFVIVLVAIFAALFFVVNYQNQKASEGNPYNKSNLDQTTIDQLDDPNYGNQILPEELAEKLDNGEDVTVYFYDPQCIHCQRTTPVLVDAAEEYGVDVVKMNLKEFTDQGQLYGIQSTPTLIHFEAGEESVRIVGEQTKEDLGNFFETEVLE